MDQDKVKKGMGLGKIMDQDKVKKFMGMGLGKLAAPDTIFPRTFRWTFHPVNHEETRWWFQKIKVNYKEKSLEISVYDDVKGQVHEWLEDVANDEASRMAQMRHYDSCGDLLYTVDFLGMYIEEHSVEYDYGKSEVLTHNLKLSFRRTKRTNNLNIQ